MVPYEEYRCNLIHYFTRNRDKSEKEKNIKRDNKRKKADEGLVYKRKHSSFNFNELLH
jgi:hypothetical protein